MLNRKMQPGDYWLHRGKTLYRITRLDTLWGYWIGYDVNSKDGDIPVMFPLDMADNEWWAFFSKDELPAKIKLELL